MSQARRAIQRPVADPRSSSGRFWRVPGSAAEAGPARRLGWKSREREVDAIGGTSRCSVLDRGSFQLFVVISVSSTFCCKELG
jgi:hypothetical protein